MPKYFKYLFPALFLIPQLAFAVGVSAFPALPCKLAWEDRSQEDYLFDYRLDSQYSSRGNDRGNEGYPRYKARMKSRNLERRECHKTWTVLIYMAATEDLEPYAYADLREMESGQDQNTIDVDIKDKILPGSSLRTDVIVQLATASNREISRLHMFHTGETNPQSFSRDELLQMSRSHVSSPIVSHFPKDKTTTEKKKLEDFLKWAIEEYPSEHYFVVIWGHGQGWTSIEKKNLFQLNSAMNFRQPNESSNRFGGVGVTPNGYLDIPNLQSVLNSVREWSGSAIDIVASDSCLMQSIEDVTQLADSAKYVCGSEDFQSYAGFPYCPLLCNLNSGQFNTSTSQNSPHQKTPSESTYDEPYHVARKIPILYQESFIREKGSQWNLDKNAYQDLTSCTVSTQHLKRALIPSMDALGVTLTQYIGEEQRRLLDVKRAIQKGSFFEGGTQDLGEFLKNLEDSLKADIQNHRNHATSAAEALKQAIVKTRYALNYAVIQSALGEKYPKYDEWKECGPKGLSIWLPETNEEFHARFDDFSKSNFLQLVGWRNFVIKVYPKTR
jgi:hypothetical protein